MENTIPTTSSGIDNITMNQNYHDEISKFNNTKVFRNLENGSLHLIAVHREEENGMIDGEYLNSQNLLTSSIIVGHHNGIANTQTLIDGQYTVNFIDENYQLHEQQVDQDGNDIQLQPAIFQMVNSKLVNQDGHSVMFPVHNGGVTPVSKRSGTANLKDMTTLTPISHDMPMDGSKQQSFQNIALPPLTPIRKLKTLNSTGDLKVQNDNKIKIEPVDDDYVIQGQINCNLPSISLQESSNIQTSSESPSIKGDLPHKKRITKKLKKPQNVTELPSANNSQIQNNTTNKFDCQLCNATIYGQLAFFAHLKGHYEPNAAVACNSEKSTEKNIRNNTLNAAPEVVNNHFGNENNILFTSQQESIKTMHSNLKSKLKENVIDINDDDDDGEFSDTDDMFEGIQNVVNKVQDGSDWYDDDEFQATMSFKPGILDDDDIDVMVEKEDSSDPEPSKLDISSVHNNDDVIELSGNIDTSNEIDNVNEPVKNKNKDNRNSEKPWAKCLICDKRFKSKNAYQYHETTHSGVRPHQCEDCGKCFSTIGALRIHSRLHTGVRPYKCRFCERPFRQWGDMKYHITSIHTNEKKYQCEFCGKGFARRYSLVVHRRIHTGERNYRCEFCDKTFRASSYLVNHRRIHTGEKPHECSICEKKFRVRSDMKRHMNIHTRSSTRPSRKPQINNKKSNNEEQSVSLSIASNLMSNNMSVKTENIERESNSEQNIDILRKVLLTETTSSSNKTTLPTNPVLVKQENAVDL